MNSEKELLTLWETSIALSLTSFLVADAGRTQVSSFSSFTSQEILSLYLFCLNIYIYIDISLCLFLLESLVRMCG